MARGKRKSSSRGTATQDPADGTAPGTPAKGKGKLALPSPDAGTNFVITDIVLRAAGSLIKDQMQKGLLTKSYGNSARSKAKAKQVVEGRGLVAGMALWGASRIARRSPLGLAVVAGGLAAKVFYDRGKRLDTERTARKPGTTPPDTET